jgi:hypothetical protein
MAKGYIGRTEIEKDFIKAFNRLSYRHNPWTVWQHFINMAACSISNAVDRQPETWRRREESYLATVKAYDKEELDDFVKMFGLLVQALEENPAQDFLGNLYMSLDFGRGWSGQFFTPWHVAEFMAQIELANGVVFSELEKQGYISVNDPACGAGCMLIAFAQACRKMEKINYQRQVLFVGQDIDRVVAQMCYIQLSLLGCPGYVVVGDTLARPTCGPALRPVIHADNEIWFTPMWFSDVWAVRIAADRFRELIGGIGETAQ